MNRPGFTLLELLVLVAIVAVLVALLLPAVQKVREAAARLQCQNNLKQIALGFHHHHDVHGAFPHGGTNPLGASSAAATNRAQWSWCYQILPYIEQDILFRNPNVQVIDATPVNTFYCPARRSPQLYLGQNKVDYAGNAGTDDCEGRNGVVTRPPQQPPCRLAAIFDGASNTVMIGEKQLNSAMLGQSIGDNEPCFRAGWNGDFEVYRVANASPAQDSHKPDDLSASQVFGSAHPRGFHVVFVDGSVRPVRYGISVAIWQRVCVRDDDQGFSFNNL